MSSFEKFPAPPPPKRRGAWDLPDAAVVFSLGLVVAGAALVYLPAAFILGGAVLVAVVIVTGGNR